MTRIRRLRLLAVAVTMGAVFPVAGARADETIKFGLSVQLSGAGAVWGMTTEWLCNQAAADIKAAGGIKVADKSYNIECIAYDNKYNAAEGTKVAQTLLNRDEVKHMCVTGTAPGLATQSLTERQGVLLFFQSWGSSTKGPKFPLTFAVVNTPHELQPALVKYIKEAYPQAKRLALLNANDASGHEGEGLARPIWERAGFEIATSDYYERGTTQFQPIAARLASMNPDVIDLASVPPAEAGQIFKELDTLGYRGIKISSNASSAEALVKTGGSAVNGVHMVGAIPFDGEGTTDKMRKLNEAALEKFGEPLSLATNGCYDAVYMLKAGIEKAQSLDPKVIAADLPTARFESFSGEAGFGGKETYGADVQPMLPVFIAQIVDGKLVGQARIDPEEK
jgi:branched-chain amino acid transport system substrate-binding protein